MTEHDFEKIDLPFYSIAGLSIQNTLFTHPCVEIQDANGIWSFSFVPQIPSLHWAMKIYAMAGNENIVLCLDGFSFFENNSLNLQDIELQELNTELLTAFIEVYLEKFFLECEEILGQTLILHSLQFIDEKHFPETESDALYFTMQSPQHTLTYGMLLADPKGKVLSALLPYFTEQGKKKKETTLQTQSIVFPLSIELDKITLSSEELESLKTGDVLISSVQKKTEEILPVRLLLTFSENTPYFHASLEKTTLTIGAYAMSTNNINDTNDINDTHDTNDTNLSLSPNFSLKELPITLSLVLDTLSLTLAEVSALQTGQILTTNKTTDEPVSITANGKIIGSGSLVNVGGRLGVQIRSIG